MPEPTLSALRVFRAVAELGSFTAAGKALGYTQSAVSRQVAVLETSAGEPLFEREQYGVRLTPAGSRLVPRIARALDDLDSAFRDTPEPARTAPVRLGAFPLAAAGLVSTALAQLRRTRPDLVVPMREASTPALVRALRHGTLDLAVVAQRQPFRPLDDGTPLLQLTAVAERDLLIAVGPRHRFARLPTVDVTQLSGEVWVASRSDDGDSRLGVWPGAPGRPDVRYTVQYWAAKLALVAADLAITTVAADVPVRPDIHLVAVHGEPRELRRVSIARMPGQTEPTVQIVHDAILDARDARPTQARRPNRRPAQAT